MANEAAATNSAEGTGGLGDTSALASEFVDIYKAVKQEALEFEKQTAIPKLIKDKAKALNT